MFMLMLRIAVIAFVIYLLFSLIFGGYWRIACFYWWMYPSACPT